MYLEKTLKNCSLKLDNEDGISENTEDVMIKVSLTYIAQKSTELHIIDVSPLVIF